MQDEILCMEKICKRFSKVEALINVDFSLKKGEVHVLIGENGAGKSTLMKVLTGFLPKDSGRIFLNGKEVEINSPKHALRYGIGMVHQEPVLVPELTVYENILLKKRFVVKKDILHIFDRFPENIRCLLERFNIRFNEKIRNLRAAEKQFVQIIITLMNNPDIIIFDEPTAYLTNVEIELFLSLIRELTKMGKSIIYISHRLREIRNIGDRITVLKDGVVSGTLSIEEAKEAYLVRMMLGEDIKEHFPKLPVETGDTVLKVTNLTGKVIQDINFVLHRGEILGVAGILGSGRTDLVRTLYGIEKNYSGKIYVNSQKVKISSPADSVKKGICFISEDRDEEGLLLTQNLAVNMTLSNISKQRWISYAKERKTVFNLIKKMGIKASDINQPVSSLSSGNKQKLLIARCLLSKSKIFLMDEPTIGVDVTGKVEIYNLMNELVRKGASIIMISSDFSELVGMCDRILVLNKGCIIKELNRKEATQEKLYYYACRYMDEDAGGIDSVHK